MVTVLMAGLIHGLFFFWESFIMRFVQEECRSWIGLANKIRIC